MQSQVGGPRSDQVARHCFSMFAQPPSGVQDKRTNSRMNYIGGFVELKSVVSRLGSLHCSQVLRSRSCGRRNCYSDIQPDLPCLRIKMRTSAVCKGRLGSCSVLDGNTELGKDILSSLLFYICAPQPRCILRDGPGSCGLRCAFAFACCDSSVPRALFERQAGFRELPFSFGLVLDLARLEGPRGITCKSLPKSKSKGFVRNSLGGAEWSCGHPGIMGI